ncbi:MAG: hypothetical protein JWP06_583 [Candidatus Saccharibacteria bacterium]|nr:hypothetical protein [Candidatus Saccharibacteria bacterium]
MDATTSGKDAPDDPFAQRKRELLDRALKGKIITKDEATRLSVFNLEQVMELLSQAAIDAGLGAVETNDLLFST